MKHLFLSLAFTMIGLSGLQGQSLVDQLDVSNSESVKAYLERIGTFEYHLGGSYMTFQPHIGSEDKGDGNWEYYDADGKLLLSGVYTVKANAIGLSAVKHPKHTKGKGRSGINYRLHRKGYVYSQSDKDVHYEPKSSD